MENVNVNKNVVDETMQVAGEAVKAFDMQTVVKVAGGAGAVALCGFGIYKFVTRVIIPAGKNFAAGLKEKKEDHVTIIEDKDSVDKDVINVDPK